MAAASPFIAPPFEADRRFVVYDVSWSSYVRMRDALDDAGTRVRLTFLEGVLELMSPSRDHEAIAKLLARLVEAYAEESAIPLNGYKSTTFRKEAKARGLEPDECYSLGPLRDVPDLAIEIVLSSGLVDKLAVYEGLSVPEVWVYRDGSLAIYRLGEGGYAIHPGSAQLPGLVIAELASFLHFEGDQTSAVRAYRAALRASKRG